MKQHHAFHHGFFSFRDYVTECKPEAYDGVKLQRIIDSFAVPFTKHLAEEVETLLQLDDLNEVELKKLYKELEAYMLDCDKVRAPAFTILLPFV